MPGDYIYDVFLSYRHENPVFDWVTNHFFPLIDQWLPEHMSYQPRIFIDQQIETGSSWPDTLQRALKTSRCLLAVCSPDYFRSRWCLAEWRSMRKREEVLGMRTTKNPLGLVYAITFVDGEHFPRDAQTTQAKDFRNYNTPYPVFRETAGFVAFDKKVQEVCEELATVIDRAHEWRSNWPIVRPRTTAKVSVKLPRLK